MKFPCRSEASKQYKDLTLKCSPGHFQGLSSYLLPLLTKSHPGPFAEDWPELRKVTSLTDMPSPWERLH